MNLMPANAYFGYRPTRECVEGFVAMAKLRLASDPGDDMAEKVLCLGREVLRRMRESKAREARRKK